jgi:gluconolactonase
MKSCLISPLNLVLSCLYLIIINTGCKSDGAKSGALPYPTTGNISLFDDALLEVIDTSAKIEILGSGFVWSEGPLWLKEQNALIFSDVPVNKIYKWESITGITLYLEPSGYTGPKDKGREGANGLALNNSGSLLICQHGDRLLAAMEAPLAQPAAKFNILAGRYNDKKLNSPNDLCVAANGDIFFTDPPYGLPGQDEDPEKEINFNGVYRLTSKADLLLVDAALTRPNGIALSRDEKFLYVANSDEKHAAWYEYSLDAYHNVVSKRLFADKTSDVASMKGLPDGLKIHSSGLIFATGPGGVLVFHPDGRHLGTVMTGEATANCAFDDKEDYLYMTAHSHLMRVRLK